MAEFFTDSFHRRTGRPLRIVAGDLDNAGLVAAYSPGTAPFAVGQAAFTITVVVLLTVGVASALLRMVPIRSEVDGCRCENGITSWRLKAPPHRLPRVALRFRLFSA